MAIRRLTGNAVEAEGTLILNESRTAINSKLASFELKSTFDVWFSTFRGIEELINLPSELKDGALCDHVLGLDLLDMNTGCTTIAALEAAHLTAYADDQHYDVQRGLILRADVHTLFDLALISIDPTTRTVVVNPSAKDDYGHLHGKSLAQPLESSALPREEDLERHFNLWCQGIDQETDE